MAPPSNLSHEQQREWRIAQQRRNRRIARVWGVPIGTLGALSGLGQIVNAVGALTVHRFCFGLYSLPACALSWGCSWGCS